MHLHITRTCTPWYCDIRAVWGRHYLPHRATMIATPCLRTLGMPAGPFHTILADPPWTFRAWSARGDGRSAIQHYPTMSLLDIQALPVTSMAAPDFVIFLWATDPMLPQALATMAAWGFTYKTVGFHWAKTCRRSDRFHTGLGYWTRANPELCLLGTRGHPHRAARDVPRLLVAPVQEHSRKPEAIQDRIERLVPGPYCELFARRQRPGWTCWGNEISDSKSKSESPLPPGNFDLYSSVD